jgi:N-acetylglucosamine-6-sulfatase
MRSVGFLITAIIAGMLSVACLDGGYQRAGAQVGEPPNIIHIMTDDNNANTMSVMDHAKAGIRDAGALFPNAYFNTSLCCPSRATQQTGLYPHNTGVYDNHAPNGGYPVFKSAGNEPHTYGVWADRAGYQTAFFGKHLNDYLQDDPSGQPTAKPLGWDFWHATAGDPQKHQAVINGTIQPMNKLHDEFVADEGIGWIRNHAADPGPFLTVLSFYAPHNPAEHPANLDSQFTNTSYPKTPAWNEPDMTDKPAFMRAYRSITSAQESVMLEHYRDRLRAIKYVDSRIGELLDTLQTNGQLDSTYIIFWADNSNHVGEHRARDHASGGKGLPHTIDSKMPLWIRGPGIAPGTVNSAPIAAVDIAPTVADMANATTTRPIDGRSFLPLAEGADPAWRKYVYAEFPQGAVSNAGIPVWYALYGPEAQYHQYAGGERELYRTATDPYQINNVLYPRISSAEQTEINNYKAIITKMKTCDAAACRTAEASP